MRGTIKRIVLALSFIVALPFWALFTISGYIFDNSELFLGMSHLLSLVPGKIGSYIRAAFLRLVTGSGDDNLYVGFLTTFSNKNVKFGKNVYIGAHCIIGWADIGNDVMIGSGIHVLSGRRQHPTETEGRNEAEGVFSRTLIDRNSWIGSMSTIMADIGSNSVIGAGSVVVKPIPPNVVAAGNPAKIIRSLDNEKR